MSTRTQIRGEGFPLATLSDEVFEPGALLDEYGIGRDGLSLLCSLRSDSEAMQRLDGFALANANVTHDRSLDELGAALGSAAFSSGEIEEYFFDNVDMGGTQIPVRDRLPGEPIEQYMRYMDWEVLRREPTKHPRRIALPYWTDAPGTRFVDAFPPDNVQFQWGGALKGIWTGLTRH